MLNPDHIKPFTSVVTLTGGKRAGEVSDVLDQICEVLDITLDDENRPRILRESQSFTELLEGRFLIGAIHYCQKRAPNWMANAETEYVNSTEELLLICFRDNFIGIYSSEPGIKVSLMVAIEKDALANLVGFKRVERERLTTAFVRGDARTLWLKNTNHRQVTQPDSKILAGMNLRFALDPIQDQGFSYSAGRFSKNGQPVIGLAPSSAKIWGGPNRTLEDFANTINKLFQALEDPDQPDQLPYLGRPVDGIEDLVDRVGEPYELVFASPDTLAEDLTDLSEHLQLLEVSSIDTPKGTLERIELKIGKLGSKKIEIELIFEIPRAGHVRVSTINRIAPQDDNDMDTYQSKIWESVSAALIRLNSFSIRYENGYTLVDGQIYKTQYRDMPVPWIVSRDFTVGGFKYNITREKPENSDLSMIAVNGEASLFSWIVQHGDYEGYLFCDDGPGETADFIHLMPIDSAVPMVELIHVKGAGSESKTRKIAVGQYEVVVSQAIKNLRWLEAGDNLLGELKKRTRDAGNNKLIFRNGGKIETDEFFGALRELKFPYLKKVTVLQPHVRKSYWEKQKSKYEKADTSYKRLSALLNVAGSSCRNLGVEFEVIFDNS